MKKIHLVVQTKDVEPALTVLRGLGNVHIEPQEALKSEKLSKLSQDSQTLSNALRVLRTYETGNETDAAAADLRREEVLDKALELVKLAGDIRQQNEEIQQRDSIIERWEKWGDFNPDDILALGQRGIFVRLYEVRQKKFDVPSGIVWSLVREEKGVKYFTAVSDKEINLPLTAIDLPADSLSGMKEAQIRGKEKTEQLGEEIKAYSYCMPSLASAAKQTKELLEFEKAFAGMKKEDTLSVLKGYCPVDQVTDLRSTAGKNKWGLLIQDPAPGDKVPTLLRNPKWVNAVKPVLDLAGILPGYKEMDISPFLLVFLSLFVGMLVGDAGYGALIGGAAGVVHFLTRKKAGNAVLFKLVYLFCGCTIMWGIFTGTYFGQQWVASFIPPVVPWLNDAVNLQVLCFLIGAVHLTVAHVWRIVLKWPSLTVLSDAGWLALIWGMFFASKLLVLGLPFPSWAVVFFIAGPLGVYLFSYVGKGWLGAAAGQIFPNTLGIIGAFTDVVSYIRLYAVGLATVAIADAANSMGFAGIVLHAINILLAALAILVHGLRLNVLEFSSHLGLEWMGFAYKPFKRIDIKG